MIRAVLLTLSFVFALPQGYALRPEACEAGLKPRREPKEVREVFQSFRAAGLNALLRDVFEDKVKISVRTKWLPWQAAVSARVSRLTGQKQIVIRGDVDVSTPERAEKFTWEIAQALFELRMRAWLWSPSAIVPDTLDLADAAKNPLEYFAVRMPREWRDQYLEQTNAMLRELYIVFMRFRSIKAGDLMPARDPGRYWMLNAVLMRNGAEAIGPNVADFEALKSKGVLQLSNTVGERNSLSVLFNYYMAHVKRALMATAVVLNLALAPHLLELPGFIESYGESARFEQTLSGAEARADETQRQTLEHQRLREIKRLNERLTAEESKTERDEGMVLRLKTELQTLVERTPGAAYREELRQ